MRTLVSLTLFVCGCASRFAALSPGDYDCTALVAVNTCRAPLATSRKTIEISGAGSDVISFPAPDITVLNAAPSVPWGTIQFGVQSDPFSYHAAGRGPCRSGTAGAVIDAQISELANDSLRLRIDLGFTGAAACTPAATDSCELAFDMSCKHLD